MGESADQLREEIAAQRDDAAAKLDELQAQFEAAAAELRGKAEEAATRVQRLWGFTDRIAARPWLSLGAALFTGAALGGLTGGHDKQQASVTISRLQPGDTLMVVDNPREGRPRG